MTTSKLQNNLSAIWRYGYTNPKNDIGLVFTRPFISKTRGGLMSPGKIRIGRKNRHGLFASPFFDAWLLFSNLACQNAGTTKEIEHSSQKKESGQEPREKSQEKRQEQQTLQAPCVTLFRAVSQLRLVPPPDEEARAFYHHTHRPGYGGVGP